MQASSLARRRCYAARVARRRRKPELPDENAPPKLAKPPEMGTGLGALLERAGLSKIPARKAKNERAVAHSAAGKAPPSGRAPSPPVAAPAAAPKARALYTTGELSALNQAYRGVEPLRRPARVRGGTGPKPLAPRPRAVDPADEAARERLGALVGGGVRFDVRWDDGFVQAVRTGASEGALTRAASARFEPEASLDLHGRQRADAQRALGEFVRAEHRRGARRLLVIVGKGQHSEDGVGVLGAAAVETLTAGGAAPLVAALSSAHPTLGGRGALAVVLK